MEVPASGWIPGKQFYRVKKDLQHDEVTYLEKEKQS